MFTLVWQWFEFTGEYENFACEKAFVSAKKRTRNPSGTPALQGCSLPWAMVVLLTFTLASLLYTMSLTRGSLTLGCSKGRHS